MYRLDKCGVDCEWYLYCFPKVLANAMDRLNNGQQYPIRYPPFAQYSAQGHLYAIAGKKRKATAIKTA